MRRDSADVLRRDPGHAAFADEMNQPIGAVRQSLPDSIHEEIRLQVSPRKAHRLDAAFDNLVPCEMGMRGVLRGMCAKVDNMRHADIARSIKGALRVNQHVDSVPGRQEQCIDPFKG